MEFNFTPINFKLNTGEFFNLQTISIRHSKMTFKTILYFLMFYIQLY